MPTWQVQRGSTETKNHEVLLQILGSGCKTLARAVPSELAINSASLRFILRNEMVAQGYGEYLNQVEEL